jgi:hypothetical protein
MEEVDVKKVRSRGEANNKKQGKNGDHAKNDAHFPTQVDF